MMNDASGLIFLYTDSCRDVIPAEVLSKFLSQACLELDRITSNRFSEVISDYADCLFDVAEVIYLDEEGERIKSESIDGYSVTYDDIPTLEEDILKIAKRYLSGTGLLYRGVF